MNRLYHLRQVYLRNIENAKPHEGVEFVLLDYGSSDGLEDWVRENLSAHIESGLVSFYRTDAPRYWVAAHAKNMAHRMATGDVLCNLDSDILIPEGFPSYIRSAFSADPDIIMAFESSDIYENHGCAGIVAARREHFYSVNGYDEDIRLGWGYDDMNYQFRCRMKNSLRLFTPPKVCLCIPHGNEIRTDNCQLKDIEMTKEMSFSLCRQAADTGDYVANKFSEWGSGDLVRNFGRNPLAV